MLNGSSSFHTRGLAPKLATMWHFPMPDEPGKVAVPYKIDSRFSTEQQDKIFGGMQEIEHHSCIRFVSNENECYQNYVQVQYNEVPICNAELGYIGGQQILNL